MMCANAMGIIASPYVTYKLEGVYHTWTEAGPPKTRYNQTKIRFDARIFQDWFEALMCSILKETK